MHDLALAVVFRQPEIDHLNTRQIILFEKHKVLRFDVSVGNLLGVNVLERLKHLFHDVCGYVFTQVFLLNDVIEQLTSLAIL